MDNGIPVIKTCTRLLLSRLQANKPHGNLPEPSQPCHTNRPSCLRNLHQHTPELSASGTFQDLLRQPTSASTPFYTGTLRIRRNSPEPSGTCLRNLHQHTPELSGTFRNPSPEPTPAYAELSGTFRNSPHAGTLRNLPEPASGTYTSIRRNFQEPSGTPLRNLQQHTTEPSGTFRNLPPEPAPATRTGTHRSLSGLKTPLAYAVGEKQNSNFAKKNTPFTINRQGWTIPHLAYRHIRGSIKRQGWTHKKKL